jgi:hypothetical protein
MKQCFSFQWHITDNCDQRCEHCGIFSERNGSAVTEMPFEGIQTIFNNCLDFFGRTQNFYPRQPRNNGRIIKVK